MARQFPPHCPDGAYGWAAVAKAGAYSVKAEVVENGLPIPRALICEKTQPNQAFGVFYGNHPLSYSFPLMLLEISFVVLATRLVRFLLKPLRQPKIVSEIIGGIIVGPSVLGRSKKFTSFMFPENADFMVKNIGIMGFMYFLFVSGVKMDLSLVTQSGKKQIWIAMVSVMIPLGLILAVAFALRNSMDSDLAQISSIWEVASVVAITSFPSLYPVLEELNLLSSEVGRMALATSAIADFVGIYALFSFEASKQNEGHSKNAGWYFLSLAFVVLLLYCIRKLMLWIVSKAHQDLKPVKQAHVVFILLGVFSMGFLTDMFGLAIGNGPFWFGLVIPDGPPLGSIIVEKAETFASDILMPFSFAFIGMYTDFSAVTSEWPTLKPLVVMVIVGYISKIIAILLACLYVRMPWKDSLALSFLLSIRGQIEVFLYFHWMDKKILHPSYFTMMVLLTTTVTAVVTPLITLLYDPTKPYLVNKRRTIQHTPPGADLRILLTFHDKENVAGVINLLESSNPTLATPFSITALCLLELVGRAAPVFIDHDKQAEVPAKYATCKAIHNALQLYQETRSDCVKLHSYTIVAPRRTMYQDICELALINKATIIIIPFNKDIFSEAGDQPCSGVQSTNSSVLSHAPCSIGIFVDKGHLRNPLVSTTSLGHETHHFAVLFLGGADCREALSYANRMLGNPEVSLTVVRFLSFNGEGDNEMEKKLDDGVVTWFWVKNETNDQVIYREVVVRNGEETVAAIQAVKNDSFDLWIMGRKQGINPVLLQGLSDWFTMKQGNHHELGIIGDYVGGTDFGGTASVLVIQQQILREQWNTTSGSKRLSIMYGNH